MLQYLAAVYPSTNLDDSAAMQSLLKSLRFYYGFDQAAASNTQGQERCVGTQAPSPSSHPVLIELCANESMTYPSSPGTCLKLPAVERRAQRLQSAPWFEVRHESFGRRIHLDPLAPAAEQRKDVRQWADFMDGGAAMWFYPTSGSGIFYQAGRTLMSPSKNEAMALLLEELAGTPTLSKSWPPFGLSRICSSTTCAQPATLARRVRTALAPDRGGCGAARLQHCGNGHVLGDAWDALLVWLGRALKYDTIVLKATLCGCGWACGPCAPMECPPTLSTTHPELVDLRIPDAVRWRADLQNRTLFVAGSPEHLSGLSVANAVGSLPPPATTRKHARIARDWMRSYRLGRVLTLRDPLNLADESRVRPCIFDPSRASLGCMGHPSDHLSAHSSDPRALSRVADEPSARKMLNQPHRGPDPRFVFAGDRGSSQRFRGRGAGQRVTRFSSVAGGRR